MWPDLYVYRRGKDFMCSENCLIVYETQRTRAANGFTEKRKEESKMALTQKQREKAVEIAVQGGDQITYLKKECGAPNPWATWAYLKKKLEKENPVKYNRLLQVETLKHAGIDSKSKMPENFQDIREVAVDTVDQAPPVEPVQCIAHVTAAEIQEAIEKQEPLAPMPLIIQGGVDYQLKVDEAARQETKPPMNAIQRLAAAMSNMPREVEIRVIKIESELGTYTRGDVCRNVIYFRREIAEGDVIEVAMTEDDWRQLARELPKVMRTLGVGV